MQRLCGDRQRQQQQVLPRLLQNQAQQQDVELLQRSNRDEEPAIFQVDISGVHTADENEDDKDNKDNEDLPFTSDVHMLDSAVHSVDSEDTNRSLIVFRRHKPNVAVLLIKRLYGQSRRTFLVLTGSLIVLLTVALLLLWRASSDDADSTSVIATDKPQDVDETHAQNPRAAESVSTAVLHGVGARVASAAADASGLDVASAHAERAEATASSVDKHEDEAADDDDVGNHDDDTSVEVDSPPAETGVHSEKKAGRRSKKKASAKHGQRAGATEQGSETESLHAAIQAGQHERALQLCTQLVDGGAHDVQALDYVVMRLSSPHAESAMGLLKRWPHVSANKKLLRRLNKADWFERYRLISILETRDALGSVDIEKIAMRDLASGASCEQRKQALRLLGKSGKSTHARKSLPVASHSN
jgi:hypothetical protein